MGAECLEEETHAKVSVFVEDGLLEDLDQELEIKRTSAANVPYRSVVSLQGSKLNTNSSGHQSCLSQNKQLMVLETDKDPQ